MHRINTWRSVLVAMAIVIVFTMTGCALVQNSTGSEEFNKTLKETFARTSSNEAQGTMPMVGVSRTYNVRAGGDVTFPGAGGSDQEAETIIKNLKAELIEAQSKLKTVTKVSEDVSAKLEANEAYHRKWHIVSGIAVILMAFAVLMFVFAISRFRAEVTRWGFDPTTVGKVANSLMGAMKESSIHMDEELSYVTRRTAENNVSNDVKAELQRQRDVLKAAKARYEAIINAARGS